MGCENRFSKKPENLPTLNCPRRGGGMKTRNEWKNTKQGPCPNILKPQDSEKSSLKLFNH